MNIIDKMTRAECLLFNRHSSKCMNSFNFYNQPMKWFIISDTESQKMKQIMQGYVVSNELGIQTQIA